MQQGQIKASRQAKTKHRRRKPSRHPEPRPGCGLCQLVHTDQLLVDLWAAWKKSRPAGRRVAIEEILTKAKSPCSVGEVEAHMSHHLPVQPYPTWPEFRELVEPTANQMTERHWQILDFITQARIASTRQIEQLFFSERHRSPGAAPSKAPESALRWMAYRHLLYRVWIPGQGGRSAPRAVCGVGRVGAELLNARYPARYPSPKDWSYFASPEDLSQTTVGHDLHVGDLFLMLKRQEGQQIEVGKKVVIPTLLPRNYWAASDLNMTITVPSGIDELGRGTSERNRVVRPDGFLVVGIDLLQPLPIGSSFGLPLLVEYDSGYRRNRDVSEQITSYRHVAVSRSINKRFPELNVPGCVVPLLFVTRGYDGGHGRIRARNLRKETIEMVKGRNYRERPPIFLTVQEEIEKHGLQAIVTDLWTGEETDLLSALLRSSAALLKDGALDSSSVLRIDPEGAAERAPKAEMDRIPKAEFEQQAAIKASKRKEIEEYEQAFAESQPTSLPPVGGQS